MNDRILVLLLACVLSVPVLAQPAAPAQGDPLQVLLQQQNALKAQLDQGKTAGMTARQVNAIRKGQKEFFDITAGKDRLDALSMEDKLRLDNALERINAQVKGTRQGQDDQDVCWREKMSGTTIMKTRCGTQGEIREAREGARDFMEKPKVCVPPGCGA